MSRKAGYIILVVLIIVSAVGIFAYRALNKPPATVNHIDATKVTAREFAAQFAADEAKANQQYLNKAIEVTGIITGTEKNQDGGLMVLLDTGDPMMAVQCAMKDQKLSAKTGEEVTIKGFYSAASLLGISLTGCIVVE
jgi:uncharacterized protein YpmB